MSDLSIEAETRRPLKSRKGSSSAEEDSSAGNCSGGIQLKKGPWTSAEDAILIEYVTKHGEGNWNAVQKDSGLSRCGKSCRLRWANHLRPDLRKGAFSPEEEHLIIELHARMGNKWARMAAELPGRTDNEIKNYWNTRIKRMQRAGKPVYPPEIRAQAMNEGHQSPDVELSMSGEENLLEPSIKNFDIPAIEFKQLELAHGYVNSSTALLNLPARSILHNDQCSSLGFLLPIHPHKGLREVETAFPGSIGSIGDSFSVFDQHEDDTYGENSQPFWSSSYAPNPNINNFSRVDMLPSNHALTNGNSSSSKPVYMAMKLELPSLQYSASQVGNWAPSSPIPSLESVDTLIQSPLSDQAQSNCPSPRNSGLLEAIVYESQHLNTASEKPIRRFSKALAGDDLLASSSPIFVEPTSDPISPFGQSSASGLFDYTPISGSSSEETQSIESMQGMKDKAEMDILRPDMLFDSCWYWYPTGFNKGPSMAAELGTHFADDLNFDLDK